MLRQFLKKRTLVTSVDVVVSCVFSGDFFAFFLSLDYPIVTLGEFSCLGEFFF